jgi:hypothetical protein
MAATSSVFTISHVAEILGEDEQSLDDIAIEMEPEDGRLTVWGTTTPRPPPSSGTASKACGSSWSSTES